MAANSCGSSQDAISGREFLPDPKLFLHPASEREFLQTPVMRNFRPRIPAGPPETVKAPPVNGREFLRLLARCYFQS
jgi:hypothetical protein